MDDPSSAIEDPLDQVVERLPGSESAFNCAKMKVLFGWTATYSWRDQ